MQSAGLKYVRPKTGTGRLGTIKYLPVMVSLRVRENYSVVTRCFFLAIFFFGIFIIIGNTISINYVTIMVTLVFVYEYSIVTHKTCFENLNTSTGGN